MAQAVLPGDESFQRRAQEWMVKSAEEAATRAFDRMLETQAWWTGEKEWPFEEVQRLFLADEGGADSNDLSLLYLSAVNQALAACPTARLRKDLGAACPALAKIAEEWGKRDAARGLAYVLDDFDRNQLPLWRFDARLRALPASRDAARHAASLLPAAQAAILARSRTVYRERIVGIDAPAAYRDADSFDYALSRGPRRVSPRDMIQGGLAVLLLRSFTAADLRSQTFNWAQISARLESRGLIEAAAQALAEEALGAARIEGLRARLEDIDKETQARLQAIAPGTKP